MCIGIRELFFFIVLTLLSLYHAAFESVGAFHNNQRRTERLDRQVGAKDCRASKIRDKLLSCEHFLCSDDGTW